MKTPNETPQRNPAPISLRVKPAWGAVFLRARGPNGVRVENPAAARNAWYAHHRHLNPGKRFDLTRRIDGVVILRLLDAQTTAQSKWTRIFDAMKRVGDEVLVPSKVHASYVAVHRYQEQHPRFHARVEPVTRQGRAGSRIVRTTKPPAPGPTFAERMLALKPGQSKRVPRSETDTLRCIAARLHRTHPGTRWTVRTRRVAEGWAVLHREG